MTEDQIIKEFPFCKYYRDGTIEIYGNESESPRITAVCPAPDINTKDGEERQKRYDKACTGIILQGYLITEKKLIHNKAFDKKGQKTTLKIVYHPCKNKEEIQMIHAEILKLINGISKRETPADQVLLPQRVG